METLLGTVARRYDQLLTRINKRDIPESLKSKYRELREARKTSTHPDKDLLNPFPLPLVIIGSKYDLLT
ncbi:dynein light intermediate chain 2 cytosolic, partial [Clonorchis sinensis]